MTSSYETTWMRKKPRVLFLLHVPPPVHGSSVIGLLVKESKRINDAFDCRFINLLASNTIAESGKIKPDKIFGFISTWAKVLWTLILHRPKLCYMALTTNGPAFFRDLFVIALLKIFRVKIIYHLHNKGFKRNITKKSYRTGYNYALKNADVILLSERLTYDISNFLNIIRIHICPNGIDEHPAPQNAKEIQIQGNDKCRILFLSNLIESKGVYVLLEACAILKNKDLSFECNFVGGEGNISKEDFNRKVIELNLIDEVKYLGKRYGKEKNCVLNDADIFAFPTFYSNECFPLVIIEAMSHSLPIVSTFEGGIPDEVEEGHNGFIVKQRDAKELAEKLEILVLNKALRKSMGEAGRAKYEKEFTLDIFEKRLVQILNKVI